MAEVDIHCQSIVIDHVAGHLKTAFDEMTGLDAGAIGLDANASSVDALHSQIQASGGWPWIVRMPTAL